MSKRIPLTQGKFAIVDDADFEWLNQYKWYAATRKLAYYAIRNDYSQRPPVQVYMHRMILNPSDGMDSDHLNRNGLDNRRSNLRAATSTQNSMNRRKRSGCSSSYKGIYWEKSRNKWRARITVDQKRISLGYFADEQDAARTYNAEAIKHFKEFANLNIVQEG